MHHTIDLPAEMEKKVEIQFAIESFEIIGFSSHTPKTPVRKDRLNFQIQHLFKIEPKLNIFNVGFRIQVTDGKQNKQELANIETITAFKIKEVESGSLNQIPEHLVVTFLSIAYSTTRGALAAKSQGTVVGEVPLPLINPTEVIQNFKKIAG